MLIVLHLFVLLIVRLHVRVVVAVLQLDFVLVLVETAEPYQMEAAELLTAVV